MNYFLILFSGLTSQKLGQSSFGLRNAEELTKSLLYAGFKDMSSSTIFEEIGLSPNWSGLTPVSVGSTVGPLLQPQAVRLWFLLNTIM